MTTTCNVDINEIECPKCGHLNAWQDVQTDGCLVAGYEDTCDACKAKMVIVEVDWEPTVYVKGAD